MTENKFLFVYYPVSTMKILCNISPCSDAGTISLGSLLSNAQFLANFL